MNQYVTLSIIIANYNNDIFLEKCLNSVLEQTFKDIEIIIFDDCSTDNSCLILKKYESKFPEKIKVIYSIKNVGVARARHEAILHAKGEYITTLDSDDYYFDKLKLEKEMELIEKYKKQNMDIIPFSKISIVDENGKFCGYQFENKALKEGIIINDLIARTCFIPRDFLVKKEIYYEIGGYNINLQTFEDWDLKIRLAKKYRYYFTGIDGTAYRRHKDSFSSLSSELKIKNLWKVFNNNISLINDSEKQQCRTLFSSFMKSRKKSLKIYK